MEDGKLDDEGRLRTFANLEEENGVRVDVGRVRDKCSVNWGMPGLHEILSLANHEVVLQLGGCEAAGHGRVRGHGGHVDDPNGVGFAAGDVLDLSGVAYTGGWRTWEGKEFWSE